VSVALEQMLGLGFYTPSGLDWRVVLDGAYGNRDFFRRYKAKRSKSWRAPAVIASCIVAQPRLTIVAEAAGRSSAQPFAARMS
jgi:hypothetical protein